MKLQNLLLRFLIAYSLCLTVWHAIYTIRSERIGKMFFLRNRRNISNLVISEVIYETSVNFSLPNSKDLKFGPHHKLKRKKIAAEEVFDELPQLTFADWEQKYLGWRKFESWMEANQTICQGFSRIQCVMLPEHTPRKAYFCFGTNILQRLVQGGKYEWLAFCEWTLSDDARLSLLEDMDPLNILSTGALRTTPKAPTDIHNWTRAPRGLTYLAHGDCNTGTLVRKRARTLVECPFIKPPGTLCSDRGAHFFGGK